jgi:hypothetical protein
MKQILAITLLLLTSCNHQQKELKNDSPVFTEQPKIVIFNKPDTVIHQDFKRLQPGRFMIHTYIVTSDHQLTKYGSEYGFSNYVNANNTYYPYENIITGNYNYIKRIKQKEYNIAASFFIEERKAQDSVTALTTIQ